MNSRKGLHNRDVRGSPRSVEVRIGAPRSTDPRYTQVLRPDKRDLPLTCREETRKRLAAEKVKFYAGRWRRKGVRNRTTGPVGHVKSVAGSARNDTYAQHHTSVAKKIARHAIYPVNTREAAMPTALIGDKNEEPADRGEGVVTRVENKRRAAAYSSAQDERIVRGQDPNSVDYCHTRTMVWGKWSSQHNKGSI